MKKQLILLAVLVLAAVILVALERPFESRLDEDPYGKLFPNLSRNDVYSLEISQLMESVVITRAGDGWTAVESETPLKKELLSKEGKQSDAQQPVKADSEKVESAIILLKSLPAGIVATNSSDKTDELQLGITGVTVKASDKNQKELLSFTIGKSGPDFMSTYVIKPGSDSIMLVGQPLVGVFSPRVSDWKLSSSPDSKTEGPQE